MRKCLAVLLLLCACGDSAEGPTAVTVTQTNEQNSGNGDTQVDFECRLADSDAGPICLKDFSVDGVVNTAVVPPSDPCCVPLVTGAGEAEREAEDTDAPIDGEFVID